MKENELKDIENQIDKTFDNAGKTLRTFVLSSVAIATSVWGIAFNLGAFKTIFFDDLFTIWVVATAVLLALLLIPNGRKILRWYSILILLSPTIWLILNYLEMSFILTPIAQSFVFILGIAIGIVCLPYSIYLVVTILNPDLISLKGNDIKIRIALVGLIIGLVGFFVGKNNNMFLTCEDFKISGNDLPVNCRKIQN